MQKLSKFHVLPWLISSENVHSDTKLNWVSNLSGKNNSVW